MISAVYPGSFDPVTMGHYDIIRRSSLLFDKVIIGVLNNSSKKSPLFSVDERVIMLRDAVSDLENVEVKAFDGLTIDFVRAENSHIIIRGLRAMADFDSELQMAQSNYTVADDVDTLFLSTCAKYSYLSSSVVKEYAYYGADISEFVPPNVSAALYDKIQLMKRN